MKYAMPGVPAMIDDLLSRKRKNPGDKICRLGKCGIII
jgi:hypothetical protein